VLQYTGDGMLAAFGTEAAREDDVECAVRAGLRFLKRHQAPDGAWDPVSYPQHCTEVPRCEPGQGGADDAISVTSQALLAFLGAGYDQRNLDIFQPTVRRGLDWLLEQQTADGSIGSTITTHAQATSALLEALILADDARLREPAQRALNRLLARRILGSEGQALAWGDGERIDTDATCAALRAVCTARSSGLFVGDAIDQAKTWLFAAWQAANPGHAAFDPDRDASVFPASWSPTTDAAGDASEAGLHAAMLLRVGERHPLTVTLTRTLAQRPASSDHQRIHHGTMGLFQVADDTWHTWNIATRDAAVNAQRQNMGCFDGRWDPTGERSPAHDRGRVQVTLWAVLRLEAYYAYMRNPRPPQPVPAAAP